jgi:DNA-binding response OmpR family regulator
MANRHRALIVEDDEATVEDLVEVLRSLDFDHVAVASFEEATQVLRGSAFCVILLDLQIKRSPDSIKGHVEHGNALLRDIRQMYPEHTGRSFWLPVIVVSGFARELSAAVDVMKDGAGDIVHKPLKSREVSDAVRRALERSGRVTHQCCGPTPSEPAARSNTDVRLAIPGDRIGRRTRVTVGQKSLALTDGSLKILLHLIVAKREGKGVHKVDLGAKTDHGFKGISRLREALGPALPSEVDIIDNDYQGTYTLVSNVVIGECALDKLRAIGDREISDLADKLALHERSPKV